MSSVNMALSAGLSMYGQIDDVFTSGTVTRTRTTEGSYVDGIYQPGVTTVTQHQANIQPVSYRDRQTLEIGGQRLIDSRALYISDGSVSEVLPSDSFTIPGGTGNYEAVSDDVRLLRNYCKVIVSRIDV